MGIGEQSVPVQRLAGVLHITVRVLRDALVKHGVLHVRRVLFHVPVDKRHRQVGID